MANSNGFLKDPNAMLDYVIDWSEWLVAGDTISSSAWSVPDGITQELVGQTTTKTTIWLSGGTVPTVYQIVNRVTTAAGRIDDRSIYITMQER